MENNKIYIVHNKHWAVHNGKVALLCPKDRTPMRELLKITPLYSAQMMCPDCGHEYILKVPFRVAQEDVISIIKAKEYQKMQIIDIDGIHTPVLKKKVASKNDKYFVSVQINDSKRGPQLVIYAGKKGHKAKTQIFVTPETKKMSFDHKDIQPTEIFTKITAQFDDETINTIGKTQND